MWMKVAGALVVGAALIGGGRRMPLTFARMESSNTARAFGIDNRIPAHLASRARGLAIIGGTIEEMGMVVTSTYRSPMLNAVLHFQQQNPGVTPDVSSLAPRNTKHAQCVALDVGANSSRMAATEIRARVLANPTIANAIDRRGAGGGALIEFDRTPGLDPNEHVHFEFLPAALEAFDDGVRA